MEPPSFNGQVYHRPQGHQQQSDYGQMQPPSSYYSSPNQQPQPPMSQQSFQQGPYQQPYNAYSGAGAASTPYDPYLAGFAASQPMMNMARAYGEQFAEQSKQKLEKVVSIARLKHYFDVDNAYVGKKLAKILLPFVHRNWAVVSQGDNEPPKPRIDVNANDLYIPLMAIITYILVAGWILGTQERFSPEQLGLISSSLLAWLFAENLVVLLTKYIIQMSHALTVWDVMSYTGYKYVGMIITLFAYAIGDSYFYYCALGYCSVAAVFFLIRSVKSYVLDTSTYEDGRKRKLYLVLFIALTQPFVMWWVTRAVTNFVPMDELEKELEAFRREKEGY